MYSASRCRICSPTRSWRCDGACAWAPRVMAKPDRGRPDPGRCSFAPRDRGGQGGRSQRARDLLDLVSLDHVALANVGIVLDRHAALETFLDLADVVLEALERAQA